MQCCAWLSAVKFQKPQAVGPYKVDQAGSNRFLTKLMQQDAGENKNPLEPKNTGDESFQCWTLLDSLGCAFQRKRDKSLGKLLGKQESEKRYWGVRVTPRSAPARSLPFTSLRSAQGLPRLAT